MKIVAFCLTVLVVLTVLPQRGVCEEPERMDGHQYLREMGATWARDISRRFYVRPEQWDAILEGFRDYAERGGAAGGLVEPAEAGMFQERQRKALVRLQRKEGQAALKEALKEPGAVQADSGLVYVERQRGEGPAPDLDEGVTVKFRGTLPDGTFFAGSASEPRESTFVPARTAVTCWKDGVARMRQGGQARFVCPSKIAWGNHGWSGKVPPGATVTLDVELLAVGVPVPEPD